MRMTDRKGPKEWRPDVWHYSSVLSDEENARLRKIYLKVRSEKDSDLLWLCELVERMGGVSPRDYDFPEYLGLVNRVAKNAFATRLLKAMTINAVFDGKWHNIKESPILTYTVMCQFYEAMLLVRPYLTVGPSAGPEDVDALCQMTVILEIDGDRVEIPAVNCLLVPGAFISKKYFNFVLHTVPEPQSPAAELDAQQQIDPSKVRGIFTPNNSLIRLWMSGPKRDCSGSLRITAGLVAAMYTTRS